MRKFLREVRSDFGVVLRAWWRFLQHGEPLRKPLRHFTVTVQGEGCTYWGHHRSPEEAFEFFRKNVFEARRTGVYLIEVQETGQVAGPDVYPIRGLREPGLVRRAHELEDAPVYRSWYCRMRNLPDVQHFRATSAEDAAERWVRARIFQASRHSQWCILLVWPADQTEEDAVEVPITLNPAPEAEGRWLDVGARTT